MNKTYLKIENPGVADPTAFTLLGASTSRSANTNATIGKFGSGNKHGVSVCLRHELPPIVFAGNLRLTFGTTPVKVDSGLATTEFNQVQVKYSGKDRYGKSKTNTEDLGFVVEYGAGDWPKKEMALREFVSNAIDRAVAEDQQAFATQWVEANNDGKRTQKELEDGCVSAYRVYEKTATPWDKVTIEIVNENQVRAKEGMTRVFIPCDSDVFKFYENIGKWFLHFSESEKLNTTILPKNGRNLDPNRKTAVIYRRGVRVREFESSDTESLFDYNIPNLELDEARNVDDWRVKHYATRALRDASKEQIGIYLASFLFSDKTYWEQTFDQHGFEPSWSDDDKAKTARTTQWSEAFNTVFGEKALFSTPATAEFAERKGYRPIIVPEAIVNASQHLGLRTPSDVLTLDDREGRTIVDATPDAQAAVDWIWDLCVKHGMTSNKEKPPVKCFQQSMNAGSVVWGFYRDGTVYFNTDLGGTVTVGNEPLWVTARKLSPMFLTTALEEVCHYVTEATDNSRDFQDWIINMVVKLALA